MRPFFIGTVTAFIFITAITVAPALADESNATRFSVSADEGYVILSEDNPNLRDNFGFGGSFGYWLKPYLELRLPLLFSLHRDEGLPPGQSADLSLLSITPGVALHSNQRLDFWVFLGGGFTLISSKFEDGNASVRERDTAAATNLGAGVDFRVWKTLSVGTNGAVMTATREVDQLDGSSKWETFVYFTAMGRLVYAF